MACSLSFIVFNKGSGEFPGETFTGPNGAGHRDLSVILLMFPPLHISYFQSFDTPIR